MTRIDKRKIIVTGAGSGIGAAIVERLAADGAMVVASDVNEEAAREVAQRAGGEVRAFAADVADEDQVARLVDHARDELGGIDVMVNNAGIGEEDEPIDTKAAETWNRIIGINLSGTFFGVKHAARVMKKQAGGGVIVNMASILGEVGFKGAPAYVAAKHGVLGLTKAAAAELAAHGIRVVAVCPAFIRTPLIAGKEDAVLPLHPIGRLGEAAEVANMVAFLASDEAAFLTGASYLVDGGYTSV